MCKHKKNYLVTLFCIICCLLALQNCSDSKSDDKEQSVDTEYLTIGYNGHSEKDIDVGIDKPKAAGYKFKLKIENKSDKKIEYYVEKLIIDDVTFKLEYTDESCKGKIDPNEKKLMMQEY